MNNNNNTSISNSYDFWKNPEIVGVYSSGGNTTQTKRFYQAREWLVQHPIKVGESLVDIGSGTGEITKLFAMCNAGGHVLAVDYSDAMVSVAQKNVRDDGISNINIWTSDAMNLTLPIKEAFVDRMVSFSAIHWFNDIGKFISGVDRYLKKDGVFFFRYAGCEGDESLELAEQMRTEKKWVSKFENFTNPMNTHSTEKMREEIKKVNMVCKKASIWQNTEAYQNREEYAKYVAGWLPHLYHLDSQEDRTKFLGELVERHCSRNDRCDENGRITVADTQIEIWGHKQK